jgi:hypothetical protein
MLPKSKINLFDNQKYILEQKLDNILMVWFYIFYLLATPPTFVESVGQHFVKVF